MKKKLLISLVPCLLVVTAVAVLIPREPMYHWWTLKRWVDVKNRSHGAVHSSILKLDKVDAEGVQFFISGLNHEDKYIREGSAELLIHCGSNALPALRTCLSSEDPGVRKGALLVFEQMDLVRIGRCYQALAKAHDADDDDFRKRVGDLLLDHCIRAGMPKAELILAEYQKNLGSKHGDTRFWSAYILALNGQQFKGMPEILISNLEHHNGATRLRAVSALALMKHDWKTLESVFMKRLKDKDARVRIRAMEALIYLGERASGAAGPFLELLDDKQSEKVRSLAFKGLKAFRSEDEKTLIQLVRLMESKRAETRSFGGKEILRLRRKAKIAIPGLLKVLKNCSEFSKQEQLITILGKIGSGHEEAGLGILPFLVSENEKLQSLAMGTLRGMKLTGSRMRERLVAMMKHPVRLTRMRGGRLLGRMGAEAEAALPVLVDAVYTKRIYCGNVSESFILIGQHVDSVALHAVGYLRLKHEWVQVSWAKRILKSMGDRAKPALPVLREILKKGGLKRRREIVEMLEIFGEASVPLLSLALQDKEESVRFEVLKTLQSLGLKGGDAVPDLMVLLKESKGLFRREVAKTLSDVCEDVEEGFLELLRGPNNELKGLVFGILQRMKSRAGRAVPTLFEETYNKELWVREIAFDTLWKIGPKAVSKLLILLKSDDADTRRCAAYALGNIGALAKDAVPAIKKCLEDEDPNVRKGARFALRKIVGTSK